MSVRNNYPLIGTIFGYLKDKRKQKQEVKDEKLLVDFIDTQIKFINNLLYERCASYITDLHIVCRTRNGREYKNDLVYRKGHFAAKVPDHDDKFAHDIISAYISSDHVKPLLPKKTNYLYIEMRMSYGEVFYINKPSYDKILRLKNKNRYMR